MPMLTDAVKYSSYKTTLGNVIYELKFTRRKAQDIQKEANYFMIIKIY